MEALGNLLPRQMVGLVLACLWIGGILIWVVVMLRKISRVGKKAIAVWEEAAGELGLTFKPPHSLFLPLSIWVMQGEVAGLHVKVQTETERTGYGDNRSLSHSTVFCVTFPKSSNPDAKIDLSTKERKQQVQELKQTHEGVVVTDTKLSWTCAGGGVKVSKKLLDHVTELTRVAFLLAGHLATSSEEK